MTHTIDAFYPYETFNSLLRFLCLSCVYHDGMKLKASWSISKNVFVILLLFLINAINLFLKIKSFDVMKTMSFSDIFQMCFLIGYFEFILVVYLVFKYGTDALLEYFTGYNNIDRYLKIYSYEDLKRTIFYHAIVFITFSVIICAFDYLIWCLALGWLQPTLFAIEYFYLILRAINVVDIMVNIAQVEFRMRVMAKILEDFYESCASLPEIDGCIKRNGTIAIEERNANNPERLNLLNTIYLNRERSILRLIRCYLLLLEQTDFINNMYGLRILMTCINFLIDTTMTLNLLIRLILGDMDLTINISVWYTSIVTIFRFAISGLLLFGKVYRAEQIKKISRKIMRIVDLTLNNKEISYEIRDSLQRLRELLISRPVEFNAVHFFKLNYRLLMSITSVVVTYTIILFQYMK